MAAWKYGFFRAGIKKRPFVKLIQLNAKIYFARKPNYLAIIRLNLFSAYVDQSFRRQKKNLIRNLSRVHLNRVQAQQFAIFFELVFVISQPLCLHNHYIIKSNETNCRREISSNFFSVKNVKNAIALLSPSSVAAAANRIHIYIIRMEFHVWFATCARSISSES